MSDSEDEENSRGASLTIAEKVLKAMTTMNSKLQKEIYNYIALKFKVAFAKSGVGIGKDHTSNILSQSTAEDFFRKIEERVRQKESNYEDEPLISNEKIQSVFKETITEKKPEGLPVWKRKPQIPPKSRNGLANRATTSLHQRKISSKTPDMTQGPSVPSHTQININQVQNSNFKQ